MLDDSRFIYAYGRKALSQILYYIARRLYATWLIPPVYKDQLAPNSGSCQRWRCSPACLPTNPTLHPFVGAFGISLASRPSSFCGVCKAISPVSFLFPWRTWGFLKTSARSLFCSLSFVFSFRNSPEMGSCQQQRQSVWCKG